MRGQAGGQRKQDEYAFHECVPTAQASTKQQPEPFLAGSIRGPEKSPEGSSISRVPWPISMRDGYIQPSPPSGAALCAVSTVPPTPRVVSVGDGDGGVSFPLSPFVGCWQGGLWICPVKVKVQGSWTVVAGCGGLAVGPVQRLSLLGTSESAVPGRLTGRDWRGCAGKHWRRFGRSGGRWSGRDLALGPS